MSVVALIPARGGSRRIPRKCVRVFAGSPMISHPIRIARDSGIFDRIVVSTDDPQIMQVAQDWGAVPLARPKELADDHTPVVEVVRHALRELQRQGHVVDLLCRIFATAVLISPADLLKGYAQMRAGARFSMGVQAFPHPVERAILLTETGEVKLKDPEHYASRTQDLPTTYYDPGQFCWGTPSAFLTGPPPILTEGTSGVVLPAHRALDIDTEEDLMLAETLFYHYSRRTSAS